MGCRLSKNNADSMSDTKTIAAEHQRRTMSRFNVGNNKSTGIGAAVDYKARLEWKLCVVKFKYIFNLNAFFFSFYLCTLAGFISSLFNSSISIFLLF